MLSVKELSSIYDVRPLESSDAQAYDHLCRGNPDYYQHLHKSFSPQSLEKEMLRLPVGKQIEDKYYLGFFDNDQLVAVLDLIDGYPDKATAFIGFFMLSTEFQGQGTGSQLIGEILKMLKAMGFRKARLGFAATNQKARDFWIQKGFRAVSHAIVQNGIAIVPAEKVL